MRVRLKGTGSPGDTLVCVCDMCLLISRGALTYFGPQGCLHPAGKRRLCQVAHLCPLHHNAPALLPMGLSLFFFFPAPRGLSYHPRALWIPLLILTSISPQMDSFFSPLTAHTHSEPPQGDHLSTGHTFRRHWWWWWGRGGSLSNSPPPLHQAACYESNSSSLCK